MRVALSNPSSYLGTVLVLCRDAYVANTDKVQVGIVSFPDARNDLNVGARAIPPCSPSRLSLTGPYFGNACRWCLAVGCADGVVVRRHRSEGILED